MYVGSVTGNDGGEEEEEGYEGGEHGGAEFTIYVVGFGHAFVYGVDGEDGGGQGV